MVMDKKIVCPSCGAEFETDKVKCPFCGTIYYKAAEAEYMDKLEDVKEDLAELKDSAQTETKGQFKKVWKWLITVLVIFAAIGAAVLINEEKSKKKYEEKERQEYLWRSKNYPVWDELYDKGDYEQLITLYTQAAQEGHNMYNFSHNGFCDCLRQIKNAEDAIGEYKSTGYSLEEVMYRELYLYELDYRNDISEEEYKYLDELRKPYLDDFNSRFGMSDEELEGFLKQFKDGRYIMYSDCRDYIEKKGIK